MKFKVRMKVQVQMKAPDTLDDAIKDAVKRSFDGMGPLEDDEVYALAEVRHAKAKEVCLQWFKRGEYLTVEIDTELGTCTVIPCPSHRVGEER